MDFALVEVEDIDVVVVIRFVAMEIIPEERLSQEKGRAKRRLAKKLGGPPQGAVLGNLSVGLDSLEMERNSPIIFNLPVMNGLQAATKFMEAC